MTEFLKILQEEDEEQTSFLYFKFLNASSAKSLVGKNLTSGVTLAKIFATCNTAAGGITSSATLKLHIYYNKFSTPKVGKWKVCTIIIHIIRTPIKFVFLMNGHVKFHNFKSHWNSEIVPFSLDRIQKFRNFSRVISEQWKFMALDYGKRRFKVKHSAASNPSKQTNLSTKHSYTWEFLLGLAYSTHRSNKNHSIPLIGLFEMCS